MKKEMIIAGIIGLAIIPNAKADLFQCNACPAGNKCDGVNKTACPAGTYAGIGASICTDCQAGTYQQYSGQASCNPCPEGKYSSAGATSCSDCASATYSDWSGTCGSVTRTKTTYCNATNNTSSTANPITTTESGELEKCCSKNTISVRIYDGKNNGPTGCQGNCPSVSYTSVGCGLEYANPSGGRVEVKEGDCVDSAGRRVCNECGEMVTYCNNGEIHKNYSYDR